MVIGTIDEKQPGEASPTRDAPSGPRGKSVEKGRQSSLPMAAPVDRLAAVIVDTIIFVPIASLLIAPFRRELDIAKLLDSEATALTHLATIILIISLADILFKSLTIALFGFSPGKYFFGLKVVQIWTGRKPHFSTSLLRSLVWWLDSVLLFPHLEIISNHRRRPLHDRVADTMVISPKLKGATPPTYWERLVIQTFTFTLGLVFLGVGAGYFYLDYSRWKDQTEVVELDSEQFLCPNITALSKLWDTAKMGPFERLPVALALFIAKQPTDNFSADCLNLEARHALENEGGNEALAYLALAFARIDSPDDPLFSEYVRKPCAINKSSESCTFSHLLTHWQNGDTEEVTRILEQLASDAPHFIKIFAVEHFTEIQNYERALLFIKSLAILPFINEFVSENRIRTLWGLEKSEAVETAVEISLNSLSESSQLKISGWLCDQQIELDCLNFNRRSCELFSQFTHQNQLLLAEPSYALTWIKVQECEHRNSINYEELEQTSLLPQAKTLVQALGLIQKNKPLHARQLLESLIEDQEAPSDTESEDAFSREARIRLVQLLNNRKELNPLMDLWLADEDHNRSGRRLGNSLFERFRELGFMDEALNLGMQLNNRSLTRDEFKKDLIVLAYRAGHFHLAWKLLNELNPKSNDNSNQKRTIASQNEYDQVAEALMKTQRNQ